MAHQAECKFYILMDGNVGASRLGELGMHRFLILWVKSYLPQPALARVMEPWKHYVPVTVASLEETVAWYQSHDADAQQIADAAHALVAPLLARASLEAQLAQTVRGLPPPLPCSDFWKQLRWFWEFKRTAVYVLVDPAGEVEAFTPLLNRGFRNRWNLKDRHVHPPGMQAFVRRNPGILTDPSKWWGNGDLVCNRAMPWANTMLPEYHALISAATKLLNQPQHPEAATG